MSKKSPKKKAPKRKPNGISDQGHNKPMTDAEFERLVAGTAKSDLVLKWAKKHNIPIADLSMSPQMKAVIDKLSNPAVWESRFKEARIERNSTNLVSTSCPNCNLHLAIPEVESHRCILCGCKELNKKPYVHP